MEISYKDNQFKIKGKTGVLYSKADGLPAQAGVLIESLDGNSSKELIGAGEYEVSGISVIGIQTEDNQTVFIYEVDGLRICNLDHLTKKLTDSKLTQIGDIDILLLPVCPLSTEMMQQIESYYVIPYDYKTQEELDKFLKESGYTVQRLPKFSLKKEELIEDQTSEIILISN